jgi:indolepyruvate decarboxylase
MGDCLFTAMEIEHTALVAPGYYATMGYGVPAGLGLQAATGQRPLILVGDGAFQMTGMELTTAVRYGLDPVVILLDNEGYGTERPMLDGPFNDVVPWHYAKLPEVLGAGRGYEIRTEGDLDDALAAALADRSGYSLLHVHIARGDLSPALQRMTSLMAERIR